MMRNIFIEKEKKYQFEQFCFGNLEQYLAIEQDAILSAIGYLEFSDFIKENSSAKIKLLAEKTTGHELLHIISIQKNLPLQAIYLAQRLLAVLIAESIGENCNRDGVNLTYNDFPISVSFVRPTANISLIYFGIFLKPLTETNLFFGLPIFNFDPKDLAAKIMQSYCQEINSVLQLTECQV